MSKKYSLNGDDVEKILIGAIVAMVGAGLTYATQIVTQIDFGVYQGIIVAVVSILVNVGRKWVAGR